MLIKSKVFFLTYSTLEIPSNAILKLMRPSLWIMIMMLSWGVVCTRLKARNLATTWLTLIPTGYDYARDCSELPRPHRHKNTPGGYRVRFLPCCDLPAYNVSLAY